MKKIKYIKFAMAALLLGLSMNSCMDDDWDDPTGDVAPYGNNNLQETNVMTIAELKDKYATAIDSRNDTVRITENVQIKARVVGNDLGGNIYNYVALDDGTSGLIINVAQGGMWAYLPIGQEILVELKDLYIGTSNYQPQIGTPYISFDDDGNPQYASPGRMNRTTWQEHFKIVGSADPETVTPVEVDMSRVNNEDYMQSLIGRLIEVKGVTLTDADGYKTFAPEEDVTGNGVSREINGSSSFVVRTSTYADFAATVMLQGSVDISGILTRYGTTWQLVMRTIDDIKQAE